MPMRPTIPLALACLALPACLADETVSGYAPGLWRLTTLAGTEVTAEVTLDLSTRGQVSGRAPCNAYSATQTAPYPWFDTGPIRATRAACPDLDLETAYLAALDRMTLAEASGPHLILSNDAGELLEFTQIRP